MRNKKLIAALTLALAGTMALGLAACGDKTEVHDDIVNGGFEQGFTGWTKSGTAFSAAGVVDTDVAGEGKIEAGKKGKYFFSGFDSGNAQFIGTMQSEPFKLGGTGKIGFLMGGGMSKEKCYVEFYEQGNDTALAKVTNEAFALGYVTDQMVRVVVDLSAHIGKTIYIKVTDNDKGDPDEYAYLNLDDFVVYKSEAEVTAAEKERTDKLAAIGKPAFSETETDTTIKNGGFEEGLVNWLMLDGDAFGTRALCSDELFWADDAIDGMTTTKNRPYNKVGNNFLNTYFNEAAQGSIRSTKFTLAGDGIISFLMAGSPSDKNYVALCDGTTDEELVKVTYTFEDPTFTENMMRHYIDASEYKGDVLYLKVVDGALPTGENFRGIVVDDFKVSQTKAEVEAQMKADYERSCTVTEPSIATAEQTYYSDYDYYPADCTLKVLRFETKIDGKAAKAGTAVNLESYLDVVTAKYGSDAVTCTKKITGVKKGDTAVATSGFNAVTIDEAGLYTVGYSVTYEGMTINETFLLDISDANHVMNSGFETGNLAGWTVEGNGASVSSGSVYWEGDQNFFDKNNATVQSYQKEGNYFLVTDEGQTVTLKSENFTISGDYISFKFGIAKNPVSYVALCDATTDAEIVKVTNNTVFSDPTLAQIMLRRFIDVSEISGVEVYIKVVDGATNDFGFLNFDDLRVNMTEQEAQALLKADQDWAKVYRQDVLDTADGEFPGTANRAKDIINAIRDYYNDLTLEGAPKVAAGTIIFGKKVEGTVELESDKLTDFNIKTWLEKEVEAYVIGQSTATIVINVTAIKHGEDDVTVSEFTPAVGEEYAITYTVSYQGSTGTPTTLNFTLKFRKSGDIQNGSFETDTFDGWTIEGDNSKVFLDEATTYWADNADFHDQKGNTVQYFLQEGKYFLHTDEPGTVTIKSSTFTVTEDYISFKFGAAKVEENDDDAYIAICDAGTDKELLVVKNTWFDDPTKAQVLLRHFVNVSALKGREVYIKIVDCDTAGFAFIVFDDLRVNMTQDAASALLQADKTWAQSYLQDVLDSNESMGGRTKDIINAIRSYYTNLTIEQHVVTVSAEDTAE